MAADEFSPTGHNFERIVSPVLVITYLIMPRKFCEGMTSPTEVIGKQRGPILTLQIVGRSKVFHL